MQLFSKYYRKEVTKTLKNIVRKGSTIYEIGCRTGQLLSDLHPLHGVGVTSMGQSHSTSQIGYSQNANIEIIFCNFEESELPHSKSQFDHVILSDLVQELNDVQRVFEKITPLMSNSSRLILNFPSNLWRPILKIASAFSFRKPDKLFNWLSMSDVSNLLYLAGYEIITQQRHILLPIYIPIITYLINRFLAQLPIINQFCLVNVLIARNFSQKSIIEEKEYSVSIVIPTLNERGNIEPAFQRIPKMGRWTELVFIDGNSTDGTIEEINRCSKLFQDKWKRILILNQTGKGKGKAVRQAFNACEGDIFMILDSDLTVPSEELPKFYKALTQRRGELINGCRLVYEMEGRAMRFLNMIANWLFAKIFSWLLRQSVKDTLCGTKVLFRKDYEIIAANRQFFGDFDPFGDFDLLFGAAKQNMKIIDMPIHYKDRQYGNIKIRRWHHGLLLAKMTFFALKKIRFP